MAEEYLIRRGDIGDLSDCCHMLKNSSIGSVYYPTEALISEALNRAVLEDEFFVADSNGTILGFIWYQKCGMFNSFPYLHIIVVSEDMQHKGIGRRLLRAYETNALESLGRLRTKVYLLVSDFNKKAFDIYKKNGYEEVHTFPGLFRKNIDEHLMAKVVTKQKIS